MLFYVAFVLMEFIAIYIGNLNIASFRMYTILSNFIALFGSVYMIVKWWKGKKKLSKIESICYASVVKCLMLTIITVFVVLMPLYGKGAFEYYILKEGLPFFHVLCPVFSFIIFMCHKKYLVLNMSDAKYLIIPTVVYAVVVLFLNLIKVMVGPYKFLEIYNQPIYMTILWIVLIMGGDYLISKILLWLFCKGENIR